MPEISVVVPVYNVERYITACVDSILNQTFEDFELILVDDGSPDNCGCLCDAYAVKDHRVRVIHQANQGLSCARNTGIDAAQGRYICFVDSDDLVAPDYCYTLFRLLDGTAYDFSFCSVARFPDGSEPTPYNSAASFSLTNVAYTANQLNRKTEFGVWNKLFRRELFDQIRFAPGKLHEDVIFSADLLLNLRNGVIATEKQLYYYRQREGSIVSTSATKCNPDRIFAGEDLLDAVRKSCPELVPQALNYAINYPWMFVDIIYVHRAFRDNKVFLRQLQAYLRRHITEYSEKNIFPDIQLKRMSLFANSLSLYAFNAYSRLFRTYLFHLLKKDAYSDGHGI